MGMASGGSKGGVKSDINITPLVDVVLVLLIIFMVVTPMLQDGVDVDMATTMQPKSIPKEEAVQVTISVKFTGDVNEGQVWFKDEWQPDAKALDAKLSELKERMPNAQIHIKADRHLNFGTIKRVMKACNSKGFESVALITLARSGDGA